MPLSQVAEVGIVDLGSNPKLVGNLRREVNSKISERPAALVGMHGQPVVLIGVNESLRSEPVDLNRAVKDLEFLGVQGDRTCAGED
jgi:hypothetical protein